MLVPNYVTVDNMMEDDRFEMGGEMYRIYDTPRESVLDHDDMIVSFHPFKAEKAPTISLIIPKKTKFKVYHTSL